MTIWILECWDGHEWILEGAWRSESAALEYAEHDLALAEEDYVVYETELRD
jgi:hypothetical protein